jgi:hypothetical protein
MNENDVLAKVRGPEGKKLIGRVLAKQMRPSLTLEVLQKSHSASGKILRGATPTASEYEALSLVIAKAFPAPKPSQDPVWVSIFAKFRDGTIAEQQALQKTIVRMGEIAQEEVAQRDTFFKFSSTAPRRSGAGGGMFF